MTTGAQLGQPIQLPPASLIIATRGRPELLLATVESILRGTEAPAELIIIDQSERPHAELERFQTGRACQLKYIWTPSAGVSRARNQGICAAKHDLLIFTDDDVLVAPAWFEVLVSELVRSGPKTIVTGQVQPEPAPGQDNFAPSTKVEQARQIYSGPGFEGMLFTGNMAMYYSGYQAVGGFDERLGPGTRYPAAEDNELGFRLLAAGYRILYVPEAVVIHRAWRTAQAYLPLRWHYGRGRGAAYAKSFSWQHRRVLRQLLGDIWSHLRSGVYFLVPDRRRAFGDLALAAGIFSGALSWRLTHGASQSTPAHDPRSCRETNTRNPVP
jgi:GT2 family glycosyltransferase